MQYMRIPLWEHTDATYNSVDGFHPELDTYLLDSANPRGLILICPGGGYQRTTPREAEPVAMQFTANGWHAAVLWYSVAPHKHPQPLLDVSRAVCIIREHATAWQIDSCKIAVCGFSAGGHLAASLGVHWNKSYLQDTSGIQVGMNRPNALMLCYPVITSGEFRHEGSFQSLLGEHPDQRLLEEVSLERHVGPQTPPTFLWHTVADQSVPVENSLLFARALRQHKIPFEMHIYPDGGHGLSLATEETATDDHSGDPHVAGWIRLCVEWLQHTFQLAEKMGPVS
jgi:acetyl esterase/lipase